MSAKLIRRICRSIGDYLGARAGEAFLPASNAPIEWRWRPSIIVIVVGMIACGAMMTLKSEADHPDSGDAREYLSIAYNIFHHGVFAYPLGQPPVPGVAREPGYPALLVMLFALDPHFEAVSRDCLTTRKGCPPETYVVAQWLNRGLAAFAGLATFALATLVTRHWVGGAVAGIGIWVNSRLLKDLNFIISDALALFLVAVLLLALLIAWRRRSPGWWCLAGLVLAALALTKAAFLYYAAVLLPLLAVAGIVAVRRRPADTVRFLTCAALFLGAFSLPTGAWMQRNADIDGRFAITEMNRAAIVLGTREIFNDFTPAQYAASFVHWTRGFGDNLARALFEPKVWKPFELDNPNGFYNTAVRRSSERAQLLIRERGLSANEAHRAVADEQIAAILSRPVIHALTTLPVIYRGIWADEFALFSFPLLVACLWISVKQRRWDIVLILSPGLFNLIFYALISYNIPRYQTTAAPDLSLALAVGVMALLAYLGRQPNAGPLPGAHPNRHP